MPIIVDKEKKRKEIIEAAISVISRTGYHRTKIKDIANEAGVGKGTIYEYFSSKQDLFLEMSRYFYEQYVLNQKRALDSVTDPEEQIRTLVASTFEQAATWAELIYIFVDMWSEMDRGSEQDNLRKLIDGIFRQMVEVLSGYISEAQARGVFKAFDTDLVSHIIIGALDGLAFQLLINKNMYDLTAMSDTLADVLIDGLRK